MGRDVEVEAARTTEVEAVTTALEQIREDQAMGAAWRRCEAALPEGSSFELIHRADGDYTGSFLLADGSGMGTVVATPLRALEALADALEARTAEMTDNGAAAEEATWD